MIPEFCQLVQEYFVSAKAHIHVDLVWHLWMGEGLMVILQVVCGFNSVFCDMGEVLGMSTSFVVSTKLLSISAKGWSGGAWGHGTHID
jgi:hypothetical protein